MIERKLAEVKWTKDEQGLVVEGVLLRVETVNYSDGPGLRYLVRGERPGEMITFPGTAGLNRRLTSADIGRRVRIEFRGFEDSTKTASGMSPQKLFAVYVDDAGSATAAENPPAADGAPPYEGSF